MKRSMEVSLRYAQDCEKAKHFKGVVDAIKGILAGKKCSEPLATQLMGVFDFWGYYERLALLNKISPLHNDIVGYYWKGVPRLYGTIHRGPLHHNWTTLLPILGITSMAKTNPLPLEAVNAGMIDDCFVQPAKIVSVASDELIVSYHPVHKGEGGLFLGSRTNRKVHSGFIKSPAIGQCVTIHFGSAIEKLSLDEYRHLLAITERAIRLYNAAIRRAP